MVNLWYAQCGALAILHHISRFAIDLNGLDAAFAALGQQRHFIANMSLAGTGNPADDRSETLDRKRPLHRLAKDAVGRFGTDTFDHLHQAAVKGIKTLAGNTRHRADGAVLQKRTLQKFPDFIADLIHTLRRNHIHLGQGHHAMPDPQQCQDIQMLPRLRHDAIISGNQKDYPINAGGAGHHRFDEMLVAGDIDNADFQIAERAWGKAQLDTHAPLFFFLEPVGLAAGQTLDQRGLAVIDMPGGSECDINPTHRWPSPARIPVSASIRTAASSSRSVRGSMRICSF